MQFDWFTFVAQLVNFLLLLLLLRRFLFSPIQRAMRRREEAVAARLKAAEVQMADAERLQAQWRAHQQAFEAERATLLAAAEAEAAALRKQMVQAARAEVAAQQEHWYAALNYEQRTFLETLRQRINEQLFAVARRALSDLANADLERQIFAVFLQRLRQLPEDQRIQLRATICASRAAVIIRSTFALTSEERQGLQGLLDELVGAAVDLQCEAAPELRCGIELQVYGQRIAWSLHHYLTEAEEQLATILKVDGMINPPINLPDQSVNYSAKEAQA